VNEDYWKGEDYFPNSSSKKDAASDLMKHVTLKDNDKILGVGCGMVKLPRKLQPKFHMEKF
jgi:trans-aconitate methyltransferase